MKIHHLNCGTYQPFLGRAPFGFSHKLVTHCILIEERGTLILIDTGFSTEDIKKGSLPYLNAARLLMKPHFNIKEAAVSQIKKLGYDPNDLKHIILTHLDYSQAGALWDFPNAKVHVFGPEYIAAMAPANFIEKQRYSYLSQKSAPKWQLHQLQGDQWFGFEAIKILPDLISDLYIIPLIGHTWGHCGVAFLSPEQNKWLFHVGDAYFQSAQLRPKLGDGVPWSIRFFEMITQADKDARLYNMEKIKRLILENPKEIDIFCSHSIREFETHSLNSK